MATHRITTPAQGHAGMVGAVIFRDGTADIDEQVHAAELAYFRAQGYGVEELADVDAEPVGDDQVVDDQVDEEPVEVADVDGDGEVEELPKRSASAAVWREFAVAHGMDPADAENSSRDELVAHYTKGEGQ